ncbi:MAG TPA: hypothetical protein V6C97_10650 [Oculatellaceae cyanobacterium]
MHTPQPRFQVSKKNWLVVLVFAISLLCGFAAQGPATGAECIRGVNFVHPFQFSQANQDQYLSQLQANGVHAIRIGVYESDEPKVVDFVSRAQAKGIKTQLILHGLYAKAAPQRAYRPAEFPGMWGGPPLSFMDPEQSKQYFSRLLSDLEKANLQVNGLELENEINMAGNNPDFDLPGEGRVLSLSDLYKDPEGKKIAAGFKQYLKTLAVLKEARDATKLNAKVPILPTSLVEIVKEGPWPQPKKYDGVSVGATMSFFRRNGLDNLVDAYNLHTYPWADGPGERPASIHRERRLQEYVDATYGDTAPPNRKPLWITEWGFEYRDRTDPPAEEASHTLLVNDMITHFSKLMSNGTLRGLFYYSWIGDGQFDLCRNGRPVESAKDALSNAKLQ